MNEAYPEETYNEEEFVEEEYHEEGESWVDNLTPYLGIYGSSTIFHVLLLALLAAIAIGPGAEEEDANIQVKAPDKEKQEVEMEKLKKKRTVESPVKDDKVVEQPKIVKEESDHNEEDVDKELNEDRGESKEFHSDANMRKDNVGDTVGLGGNAGGNFGRGQGGNENLGTRGSSGKTQLAVLDALKWLARHQSDDGHWDIYGYRNQCNSSSTPCKRYVEENRSIHNVGVTGLALLAYLGSGFTHMNNNVYCVDCDVLLEKPEDLENEHKGINFGDVVKKGLFWLKNQQNEKGAFETNGNKPMYDHAIASMAYAEAYGMTGSNVLEKYAQKGINYLSRAQNPYKAWRYTHQSGDNDTSVTGWAVMALKSGEIAGLNVGASSFENALNFIKEVTETEYYRTGYRKKEQAGNKVRVEGKNDRYTNHPALTSIGMLVRMYAGADPGSEALKGGVAHLMDDLPKWEDGAKPNSKGNPIDYYYWYYGSLAMYMYAGPDSPNANMGNYWSEWNDAIKTALLPNQKKQDAGCEYGSWEPISRWSFEGGRVYATAINALTMEVYYRYDNAFTGMANKE